MEVQMRPGDLAILAILAAFACGLLIVVVLGVFRVRLMIVFLGAVECPCYRDARAIAGLIYDHPEQWAGDDYNLRHSKLGAIWTANGVEYIKLKTPFGDHRFSAIERQIIWDAVRWRIKDYAHNRLMLALQANTLPRN
jgi:hypothetical protein